MQSLGSFRRTLGPEGCDAENDDRDEQKSPGRNAGPQSPQTSVILTGRIASMRRVITATNGPQAAHPAKVSTSPRRIQLG
jgi:hypothetical protein